MNAHRFSGCLVDGGDIDVSPAFGPGTLSFNELFLRLCSPACDLITLRIEVGSDLGILRARRRVSKAAAARRALRRAVFRGGVGVRRRYALLRQSLWERKGRLCIDG